MVELDDVVFQLAATPQTPTFVECFGVVQFDLQLGQVLEFVYPPLPFSVQQETEIAFLCFPDANHIGDGDTYHDFVYAFNESEMDKRRTLARRAMVASAAVEAASGQSSSQCSPRGLGPALLQHAATLQDGASPTMAAASAPSDASPSDDGSAASSFNAKAGSLTKSPSQLGGASSSSGRKQGYDATVKSYFCSTLFRQRRDATVTRGAQQKALVVMSKYPFPALFHRVLRTLCAGVFDGASDPETVLQAAWRDVMSWPRPLPCRNYPTLPFLGEVLSFVSPLYDPNDASPASTWSLASLGSELTVHEESVTERLRVVVEHASPLMDTLAEAVSDYLAVVSPVPAPVMEWLSASGWSHESKSFGTVEASPGLQLLPLAQCLRRRAIRRSPKSPPLIGASLISCSDALMSHFRQDAPRAEVMQLQDESLKQLLEEASAVLESLMQDGGSPCPKGESRLTLSEMDVHGALFPHITKAWKLWELMIVGEPVAFLGPSAPAVSAMALSMAAIIAPLQWTGLMRPYVTINNREIDHGIDKRPYGPTVVGATNPFFVRHLDAWPHMICVSSDMTEATSHKMWPADSDKRQKQQFKLKNRMFCSRHYLVKTDKTWGGEASHKAPDLLHTSGFVDTTMSSASPSASVLKTFARLTVEFLQPLRQFIAQVMQLHQPYFLADSELRQLLSHRRMAEYLAATSASLPSLHRFKNGKDALEVYQAFILSPTGQRWVQSQIRCHYRRFLLEDVSKLEDVVRITPNVGQRRMTLARLQWDLERCIDAPTLDVPLLRKLMELCKEIVPLREALYPASCSSRRASTDAVAPS